MTSWVAVARLFGRLLLREIDQELLDELRQPSLVSALAVEGIDVPRSDDALETLAEEYFECFLGPSGTPLVQSLWEHGQYEGPSTASLRKLADSAALEFNREAARNAPVDHLGCLLLLWAELSESDGKKARWLASQHLNFADQALAPVTQCGGFYGSVATACRELCQQITGDARKVHGSE